MGAGGGGQKNDTPARARARVHMARPETLADQVAFLDAFAVEGVITAAAERAGIERQRHYEWLADEEKYPNYREAFAAAHEQACDRLEIEAKRRAVEGWEEPVFGSGGRGEGTVQVGVVRKFSDRMLELLLKARRPDRFRERSSMELTGKDGAPIGVVMVVPDNGRGDRSAD